MAREASARSSSVDGGSNEPNRSRSSSKYAVHELARIGVVGVNGSGKTTLLRLIAGAEQPDTGRIIFVEGVSLGYLPQNPPYEPGQTVLDAVFAASDATTKLLLDYERACQMLASGGGDDARLLRAA